MILLRRIQRASSGGSRGGGAGQLERRELGVESSHHWIDRGHSGVFGVGRHFTWRGR